MADNTKAKVVELTAVDLFCFFVVFIFSPVNFCGIPLNSCKGPVVARPVARLCNRLMPGYTVRPQPNDH